MVGFAAAGSASLWKSRRLFSTGIKEAELMLDEPGLNPRMSARQFGVGCRCASVASKRRSVDPSLSTAFAEPPGLASTGCWGIKEVVLG